MKQKKRGITKDRGWLERLVRCFDLHFTPAEIRTATSFFPKLHNQKSADSSPSILIDVLSAKIIKERPKDPHVVLTLPRPRNGKKMRSGRAKVSGHPPRLDHAIQRGDKILIRFL